MDSKQPYFSRDLPKAINDWQAGSFSKKTKALRINRYVKLSGLNSYFTSCDQICYRRSVLSKSNCSRLFFEFSVPEETSSWTVSQTVAMQFKGGAPDPPLPGVIFSHKPQPDQVILNLDRLFHHSEFWPSVNYWEKQGQKLLAIRRYANIQREVILKVDSVPHTQIFAFGSNSAQNWKDGDLEKIQVIGHSALSISEITKIFSDFGIPTRRWLIGESVQRVYLNWLRKGLARLIG